MVTIEFLGPIGKENIQVDIKNLNELKACLAEDDKLQEWLEISSIALNDTIVSSLDVEVKSGDKISILPPVCGG